MLGSYWLQVAGFSQGATHLDPSELPRVKQLLADWGRTSEQKYFDIQCAEEKELRMLVALCKYRGFALA